MWIQWKRREYPAMGNNPIESINADGCILNPTYYRSYNVMFLVLDDVVHYLISFHAGLTQLVE